MAEKLAEIIRKPRELLGGAIKAIKGPDVQQMVETFTGEMTVVVEGLYDDQMRLRKELEDISAQQTILSHQLVDGREESKNKLEQSVKELSTRLTDMQKRLQALESKHGKRGKGNSMLSQATVLVSIAAGAWVIVTVLNLFK